MLLDFSKYSATGNDFVIIDNRTQGLSLSVQQIAKICDRKWGVGADGLIQIKSSKSCDFLFDYANSDGKSAEMCGNGLRASVHFCHNVLQLKSESSYSIESEGGKYLAEIDKDLVEVEMTEIRDQNKFDLSDLSPHKAFYVNTGVPHSVFFVNKIDSIDLMKFATSIRSDSRFDPDGSNVMLAEVQGQSEVKVRSFERGVEGETLSCGTGATAVALAYKSLIKATDTVKINTRGGQLQAKFQKDKVLLKGPAIHVFAGQYFL